MGRPKGYERDAALVAARDLFWQRGYQATAISDLEQQTGLNRSSLYQEFGSKQQLFEAALECYADEVVALLLAELNQRTTRLDGVAAFFDRLGDLFRSDAAVAARGCLLVNSIAELHAGERSIEPAATAYRHRLRAAFGNALANAAEGGEIDANTVDRRAWLLASTLMGIWLTVRTDPADAVELCETVAAEVRSWRRVTLLG
jgi:AcrR family transcriptional regulator